MVLGSESSLSAVTSVRHDETKARRFPIDLRFVEDAWTLRVREAVAVADGSVSHNWVLVTGAGRRFLKRYQTTSPERVAFVHAAQRWFADRAIPAVLPIPATDGRTLVVHDGHVYALFPYVDGRTHPRPAPARELASLAAMMARMHQAGAGATLPEPEPAIEPERPFVDEAQRILAVVEDIPAPNELDRMVARNLRFKLELAAEVAPPDDRAAEADHLVHGDFHDMNVFFDHDGHVAHVFDFDAARYRPRAWELVRALPYVCIDWDPSDSAFLQRSTAFVRTYHTHYPITPPEIESALERRFRGLVRDLWVEREHYVHGSTRVDWTAPGRIALLRVLAERRDEILERLAPAL